MSWPCRWIQSRRNDVPRRCVPDQTHGPYCAQRLECGAIAPLWAPALSMMMAQPTSGALSESGAIAAHSKTPDFWTAVAEHSGDTALAWRGAPLVHRNFSPSSRRPAKSQTAVVARFPDTALAKVCGGEFGAGFRPAAQSQTVERPESARHGHRNGHPPGRFRDIRRLALFAPFCGRERPPSGIRPNGLHPRQPGWLKG